MMAPLNRILVWLLPRLPKALAARFAGRYVAGESVETALTAARDLNERGFEVTLDILGEHVTAAQEARDVTQAYVHLFGAMAANSIKGNISVKPTHLGLDLSADLCRDNFIALLRQGLSGGATVAIATHDQQLISAALELLEELGTSQAQVEFQVLYGVPMQGRLEQLLRAGYKVRVYVPFGEEWYDYGLRRLKENPAIAGYILKNIFHRAS